MAEMRSAWRTGDSAAYEAVRTALDALVEHALSNDPGRATTEVVELRKRVLATDGFDRAAVDALRAELEERVHAIARSGG